MLFRISRVLTTFGMMAAAAGSANTALGQLWWYNPCCCCPPPIRVQPCYQTVPVTEMREVRQVVQKPIIETKYVEQPCTEYRRVVETKTAEVPTVSYQNVTEYHTVQRDCGHWYTQYHCRPKMNPCQYDARPDILGFLNRTQYSLRMAFTPDYYSERVYVPNVVSQQVPVTRQVAIRGTQTINYQVAKVVPIHTTRKVAVNTVRMVPQEIVTQRPVTVMKTIPFGSAYALGAPAAPSSTTALSPVPDPGATAILPRDREKRPAPAERIGKVPEPLRGGESIDDDRESDASESKIRGKNPQGSLDRPAATDEDGVAIGASEAARPIGKWVARRKPQPPQNGPAFPEMTLAQNDRK